MSGDMFRGVGVVLFCGVVAIIGTIFAAPLIVWWLFKHLEVSWK